MAEKEYVDQVKAIISGGDDNAEKLKKIYEIPLPDNANPLLALIHGDSFEVLANVKFLSHDYFADEVEEVIGDLPTQVIKKLKKYLKDWDDGYSYAYLFSIKSRYDLYKDSRSNAGSILDQQYLQKELPNVSTVNEAVHATKDWKEGLPKTKKFDENQTFGHKRKEVITCFEINAIHKVHGTKPIVSGVLLADHKFLVTSWLVHDF